MTPQKAAPAEAASCLGTARLLAAESNPSQIPALGDSSGRHAHETHVVSK